MVDKRIVRRGVAYRPRAREVEEAKRCVRAGIPIHARWLPFLPPAMRVKARIYEELVLA